MRPKASETALALCLALPCLALPCLAHAQDWPSFRGRNASGVADGQRAPERWDAARGVNVAWKTPIPGLGHGSPIVWGRRLFVATAISSDPQAIFKPGLDGSVDYRTDVSPQEWRVYCLDTRTGKILWVRLAHAGTPRIKRHPKSSHASATPATDGRHLVVFFGSEGLFCYDLDGRLLWKKDLGVIHAGKHDNPEYQWGTASSPVIHDGLAIVLCDGVQDSFIAAYDLRDGREAWRTPRDAHPSWSTPTIVQGASGPELVTNAAPYIRAYDPKTGCELWKLGPNSTNTTPTPVAGEGMVFVTSGYRPIKPIYAVRAGGRGDLSLAEGSVSSKHVAWSTLRDGPYMATPLLYRGYLYTVSFNGVLACYRASSGESMYQVRVEAGAFSASPIAADGRIYVTGEDGAVFVVRAGPRYELLHRNTLGEVALATPAISDGMILIRTQRHVLGIR
jgi:outer membrane protein assembly factor BamB